MRQFSVIYETRENLPYIVQHEQLIWAENQKEAERKFMIANWGKLHKVVCVD